MTESYETETSAGGIVYKKKGELFEWLVIQHSAAKHWGFPKGHVGDKIAEEKMEDAALREVKEEGGITAQIVSHEPVSTTYFYKLHGKLRKKTVHYFLMEYVSGSILDHDWEVQEAKFVTEKNLPDILTYDSDRKAFAQLKALM